MRKKRLNKKNKEHFKLTNEYKKSFEFLKSSKEYIYTVILVFLIFTTVGFFFSELIDSFFNSFSGFSLNERILNYIQNILEKTEGMSQKELTGFIFINNLQSSFLSIVFGIFLGIFPIFSAIINGYLLGFVAILSVKIEGFFILWRILPHGIFELPAIFISFGLGLRLGIFLFASGKDKKTFPHLFLETLRVFILIVIPLLIIAAIIEGLLISVI